MIPKGGGGRKVGTGFRKKIMLDNEIERDDDSTFHPLPSIYD